MTCAAGGASQLPLPYKTTTLTLLFSNEKRYFFVNSKVSTLLELERFAPLNLSPARQAIVSQVRIRVLNFTDLSLLQIPESYSDHYKLRLCFGPTS